MRNKLMIVVIALCVASFMAGVFVQKGFALDYPKPELDHEAAVERIEDAKLHWLEKGEPSDADTPPVVIVIDYLDLRNAGLSPTQRFVIVK